MAIETYEPPDQQSFANLVSGIINDAQELVKQEVALVREEIRTDMRKAKEALAALALGLVAAAMAAGPIALLFIALLHEYAGWSWSASAGLVGAVMALVAASLTYFGIRRIQSANPMTGPSVAALKENLEWIKNPK